MRRVRATFGVVLAVLVLAAYAWLPDAAADLLWARQAVPSAAPSRIVTPAPEFDLRGRQIEAANPQSAPFRLEETPGSFDIRGNEIARPVATYRLDDRGSLYEVHSPETEVPRLKPPQL
jgi:hypothetical protein